MSRMFLDEDLESPRLSTARSLRGLLAISVCLLAPIGLAGPAHAVPDPSEMLIRQGVELRLTGRDADALEKFERAYEMAHTPRAAAHICS